jgi:phage terminase small subunit
MTLKEKLIEALGDDCTAADNLAIELLLIYYEIFKQAAKDLKDDGNGKYAYRRRVSETPVMRDATARWTINNAFTVMNDCAKQIRAEVEVLGLSKKGRRIEVVNKIEKTLLERMNDIPDEG